MREQVQQYILSSLLDSALHKQEDIASSHNLNDVFRTCNIIGLLKQFGCIFLSKLDWAGYFLTIGSKAFAIFFPG